MMKPYFQVDLSDNRIQCILWFGDPDAGPTRPISEPMPGTRIVDTPLARDFTREGRTDTEVAYWRDDHIEWIESATIESLRQEKANEISKACRTQIEAGFICEALGAPFLYPAKAQDQANLNSSVTDSLLFADEPGWQTPFWCADELGEWAFRMHTRDQIQQVGRAGKVSILGALQKNEAIQQQIMTAGKDQLKTIYWSTE